jgi:hypothetical protein
MFRYRGFKISHHVCYSGQKDILKLGVKKAFEVV